MCKCVNGYLYIKWKKDICFVSASVGSINVAPGDVYCFYFLARSLFCPSTDR